MTPETEYLARRPVLYVDDQPANVEAMVALFSRRPAFRLVVAANADEAVRRACGLRPALLMLDMRQRECRSGRLLPMLRMIDGCEDAPAVGLSASSGIDLAEAGLAEVWTRPLDVLHVLRRLDALTRRDPHPARLRLVPAASGASGVPAGMLQA